MSGLRVGREWVGTAWLYFVDRGANGFLSAVTHFCPGRNSPYNRMRQHDGVTDRDREWLYLLEVWERGEEGPEGPNADWFGFEVTIALPLPDLPLVMTRVEEYAEYRSESKDQAAPVASA